MASDKKDDNVTILDRKHYFIEVPIINEKTDEIISTMRFKIYDPPAKRFDEYITLTSDIGTKVAENMLIAADIEKEIDEFVKESENAKKSDGEKIAFSSKIGGKIKELDSMSDKDDFQNSKKIIEFIIKKKLSDDEWKHFSKNMIEKIITDYEEFIGAKDVRKNAPMLLPSKRLQTFLNLGMRRI